MAYETKQDVYAKVTDSIVAALEKGVAPWHKPWNAANTEGRVVRPLRVTGEPYQGINVLILWSEAANKGYTSPFWMTYHQALEFGGNVRRGEHGTAVVKAGRIVKTEQDKKTGEDVEKAIPFLRTYAVFNVDQIENLPGKWYGLGKGAPAPLEARLAHAEAYLKATGASITERGAQAFYAPSQDRIQLPPFASFEAPEHYYSTAFHELTHWTRHESRLNRTFNQKRWGDEGYAVEELVAELGAAFLSAALGITPATREDHAAYIAAWLRVLKQDKRAIFSAAAYAQRAVDYLDGLQPGEQAVAVAA